MSDVQKAIREAHNLLVWTYQHAIERDLPPDRNWWHVSDLHPGVYNTMNSAEQSLYTELLKLPDGWQPIDTAPKMKTILLFAVTDRADDGRVRNWKMATGFWHEGWTDCRGTYEEGTGRSPWCWEGRHIDPWEPLPTHWMPLPEPPR